MIASSLLLMIAAPAGPCVPSTATFNGPWVAGEHTATPVAAALQQTMLERLKDRPLIPIDVSLARRATGDLTLPLARRYYLAKVGYAGEQTSPASVPGGVNLSVDVDNRGVAYVTSFRLGSWPGQAELAAVLSSRARLKRVVSSCMAAE